MPAGTPGRASLGAKVVSANLNLTDVFSAAPGWYLWHVVVTPYNRRQGHAERRRHASPPSRSTARRRRSRSRAKSAAGGKATVRGRVTAGFKGVPGATVTIAQDKKSLGTAKTGPGGRFKASVTVAAGASITATAVAGQTPRRVPAGLVPGQLRHGAGSRASPSTSEPVTVS